MQVFKAFFAIVRKNIGLMILYAALSIFLTIANSGIEKADSNTDFSDSRLPVTVIDRDNSEISSALQSYLYESQNSMPLEDDDEILRDALYRRQTYYVVFIPKGYGTAFTNNNAMQVETTAVPGAFQTMYLDEKMQTYIGTLQAYVQAGFPLESAVQNTTQDIKVQTQTQLKQISLTSMPRIFSFFKYLCYGFGLVMVYGLAPVMFAFNGKEIQVRMNASALTLKRKNAELWLAAITLAIVCFAVYVVIGFQIDHKIMLTKFGVMAMLNGFIYLLFSTALGLLIGQISKNSNSISAISNVVVLGLCFLGGVFVSVDLFGTAMQNVAKFMPTYWYIKAISQIANSSITGVLEMGGILQAMGMQVLFTVALVLVAVIISKKRQRIA